MNIFRKLIELIYPDRAICMGCGDMSGMERPWLCERCASQLEERPKAEADSHENAVAAVSYRGAGGGVVRNLKFRGVTALAKPMAERMVKAWRASETAKIDVVTYVPMQKSNQDRRGFNQSELLANEVAKALNCPCRPLLTRIRKTKHQVDLTGDERRANLIGAFRATETLKGETVLLVDDVLTTGATASACGSALKDGGASEVWVLTYAQGGM